MPPGRNLPRQPSSAVSATTIPYPASSGTSAVPTSSASTDLIGIEAFVAMASSGTKLSEAMGSKNTAAFATIVSIGSVGFAGIGITRRRVLVVGGLARDAGFPAHRWHWCWLDFWLSHLRLRYLGVGTRANRTKSQRERWHLPLNEKSSNI